MSDLNLNYDSSFGPAEKKNIESYLLTKGIKGKNILFSGAFTDVKKKKVWDLGSKNQQQEEEKLLVVSQFRFFVFTSSSGKLLFDSNILDLLEYQTNEGEAALKFRQPYIIAFNNAEQVPNLALAVQKMYSQNFPGMHTSDAKELVGPCGGFSRSYRCISDFYNIPAREDICWEIDNLFETNNIKELNLSDWPEPPTASQGKALVEALKYNLWFESLVIFNNPPCKISNDGMLAVNTMLQTNKKISKLTLQNINARESWMTPETWMTIAMNNYLHTIDLSNNAIEDRGAQSLCNDWLSTVGHEINVLNLAKCNIGKQGLQLIFNTMRQNKWISKNIKFLSISGNKLEDAAASMVLFLAEAPALRQFEMANCMPTWSAMKPPATIQKSKETRCITRLDLSNNRISASNKNAAQEQANCNDLSTFLQLITPNLSDFNLSSTFLTVPSIYPILSSTINLVRLDLSDNSLEEEGISHLVDTLCQTTLPKLKHLYINRNFSLNASTTDIISQTLSNTLSLSKVTSTLRGTNNASATKESAANAIKKLCVLISPASFSLCPLETLHIAGSSHGRLKSEIVPLAQALLKNDTITEIDISGHQAGDDLAIALGRVIQVNRTIKTLYWDENLTTTVGMEYFVNGFKKNPTLQHMPLPVLDIADFLKQPENSPSMQLIKERLKLVDTTTTVQQRMTQLASEIQSQIINNNLRKMKDAINKAVSRKRTEAAISSTMSPLNNSLNNSSSNNNIGSGANSPPTSTPTTTPSKPNDEFVEEAI
ncbi:hypothetical protein CYY_004079 [Polysphondylium violaceum]|uniref:Leucine-rich repeat-containing protein n=1 Tax=Polysphondylium violaceum TaxID=133409 RepID=A0A8J4V835_9MYCE|nr:hypothetical protein CYY_004079 [Polysphondylium violaceum]